MGSLFEHLLSADESGGLGVSLVTQPPGIATPLHRHTHEDEAFFLLDGTMTYRAGDEVFQLADGRLHLAAARAPARLPRDRDAARCGSSASPTPAGCSGSTTRSASRPASAGCPAPTGSPMAVEIPRWNEVGPRYGLEVVGPPLPEET